MIKKQVPLCPAGQSTHKKAGQSTHTQKMLCRSKHNPKESNLTKTMKSTKVFTL